MFVPNIDMPYIDPFNGSETTTALLPTSRATSSRISYLDCVSCSTGCSSVSCMFAYTASATCVRVTFVNWGTTASATTSTSAMIASACRAESSLMALAANTISVTRANGIMVSGRTSVRYHTAATMFGNQPVSDAEQTSTSPKSSTIIAMEMASLRSCL